MISKQKCKHCGRNDYHRLLSQHITAMHPSKAPRMVPLTFKGNAK